MFGREKRDLLQLDKLDRFLVVSYWRVLRARAIIFSAHRRALRWERFPLPIKFPIVQFGLLLVGLIGIPRPNELPTVMLPLLWMGAYCFTVMLLALGYRRRPRIHWI